MYTINSFFYVVSTAFHTSVPALRKSMNISRKKLFWLKAQPLVHHVEESLLQLMPFMNFLVHTYTFKNG